VLAENALPEENASAVTPLARHAPTRSRHRCSVEGAAPEVFLEETVAMPPTVHPAKRQRKNAGSCSAYIELRVAMSGLVGYGLYDPGIVTVAQALASRNPLI